MFNWDLDTDLLALLPPWYRDILDYQQICKTESEQLQRLSDNIVRIDENFYFQTMDEQAVSLWEAIFGILPDMQTETLEFRRERLLIRIKTRSPFTLAFLYQKLDELVGAGNWKVDLDYANYRLDIELNYDRLDKPSVLWDKIAAFLAPVKPAHILLRPAMSSNIVFTESLLQNLFFKSLRLPYRFFNQPNDVTLLNGRRRLDGSWKLDSAFRGITSKKLYIISGFAEKKGSMQGSLTRDTMWRLDGWARLDGSKKLNAAIIKEEL